MTDRNHSINKGVAQSFASFAPLITRILASTRAEAAHRRIKIQGEKYVFIAHFLSRTPIGVQNILSADIKCVRRRRGNWEAYAWQLHHFRQSGYQFGFADEPNDVTGLTAEL
jgi:hypothetical protein